MVRKAFIALFLPFIISCTSPGPRFKIYKLSYDRGLLVRDRSDKDVLTFEEAHGYLCISPTDLERLAEEIMARKNQKEGE